MKTKAEPPLAGRWRRDLAAVELDELLADGEPQPRAARAVAVAIEDQMKLVVGQPLAIVLHHQLHHRPVGSGEHLALHQHVAVLRGVLQGVGDEVLQHLAELQLVPHDRKAIGSVGPQRDASLGGEDLQLEGTVAGHLRHVEELDVERHPGLLALPPLEEGLDHLEDLPRLPDHRLGGGLEVSGEPGLLQHPPVAEGHLKRRAEVVADDGDQLVLEAGQLPEPAVASVSWR